MYFTGEIKSEYVITGEKTGRSVEMTRDQYRSPIEHI